MKDRVSLYTYRNGARVELRTRPDRFVARVAAEDLRALDLAVIEQISPRSFRVAVEPARLQPTMAAARRLGPVFHDYEIAATGQEFLITDRIFVTFTQSRTKQQVVEFARRRGLALLEKYTDRDFLFQTTDGGEITPVDLVVALNEEEPFVAAADHDLNYRATTAIFRRPNDPVHAQRWRSLNGPLDLGDERPPRRDGADTWQALAGVGGSGLLVD